MYNQEKKQLQEKEPFRKSKATRKDLTLLWTRDLSNWSLSQACLYRGMGWSGDHRYMAPAIRNILLITPYYAPAPGPCALPLGQG